MYTEIARRLGDDVIEVQQYGYSLLGGPGKSRKRRKETSERGKRANEKTRARRMQRLMLTNFKPGDLHIVLNFHPDETPATYEEATLCLRKTLRRIRKYYEARGHQFQYIAVVERGKRKAALHIHLITKSIDEDNLMTMPAIQSCWKGKATSFDMYEQGDFEQLADYIVKAAGKEENDGVSYHRSRNLKEPEAEKKIVWFKAIPEPQAPKGWYVVKDSVRQSMNPYTKKPCQRYLLKRIKPENRINILHTASPETGKPLSVRLPGQKTRKKRENIRKTGIFEKIKQAAGRLFR